MIQIFNEKKYFEDKNPKKTIFRQSKPEMRVRVKKQILFWTKWDK